MSFIKSYKQWNFNSSNKTSNVSLDSSNYTSNVNVNSSNYTTIIKEELSDRIGFPASLFPVTLPSGVYIPIKAQEIEIAEVGRVVGLHAIAIGGIEKQIWTLVGVEGGEAGLIAGAITTAGTAYNKATNALNKINNLTVSTTQDTEDTSNYTIHTSNVYPQESQIQIVVLFLQLRMYFLYYTVVISNK